MITITYQEAITVLPAETVHTFSQAIEKVGPLKGSSLSRLEAEALLAGANEIVINDLLQNKHPLEHGISIKQGKGIIFFQTIPELLEELTSTNA